ncbi:hypothetical protein AAUPMC_17000, partial [Pasteurella multocida subsp. multocida str. Anand1_cattle]
RIGQSIIKNVVSVYFAGGGSTPKVAQINEIDSKYHRSL